LLTALATTAHAVESWTVDSYKLTDVSSISEPEAASWLGKTAQIGPTSIVFGDKRCLAQPRAHDVDTASFLTARLNVRPEDIGVSERSASLIETGCSIPGFETLVSLGEDRMALLYRGVVFFLSRKSDRKDQQRVNATAGLRRMLGKSIPEAGVTVKYPEGLALTSPYAKSDAPGLSLWFATEKVSELDNSGAPLTRSEAERDQAALQRGEFGEDVSLAVPGSKKVVSLKPGVNVKTYARLSLYENCDVSFLLTAVLYNQGRRVALTLAANPAAIMEENPAYFARAECGDNRHWDFRRNAADIFYRDLAAGRVGGLAGAWLQTFQAILNNLLVQDAQPVQAKAEQEQGFLLSDHEACRSTAVFAKDFPGYALVKDKSFGLSMPGLSHVCFLTLESEQAQRFALYVQNRLLSAPAPAQAQRWTARELVFPDLNGDKLPEIVALMDAQASDGERYVQNEIYFSQQTDAAPQWSADARVTREIRGLTELSRVLSRAKSLLANPVKGSEAGLELVGQLVEEGVYLTFVPQHDSKDVIYNLAKLPPSLEADYDDILQREIWIRARVLRSELVNGVTTFHLEVLDYKLL
jgi:hypothetical protein